MFLPFKNTTELKLYTIARAWWLCYAPSSPETVVRQMKREKMVEKRTSASDANEL